MKNPSVGALIVFLLAFSPSILPGTAFDSVEQNDRKEKYIYTAFPLMNGIRGGKETIEVAVTNSHDRILYTSYTTREVIEQSGDLKKESLIWRESGKAYSKRGASFDEPERTYDLPFGMELAVDASLIMRLRSFPFGEGKSWKVYMVDFSQIAVSVKETHTGSETVHVPAGVFECHRVEVSVDLPIV